MILSVPFTLILAHFVGDWLLQNDWMALNKSKQILPLAVHAAVVAFVTGLAAAKWLVGPELGFWFILITFVCHFWTDYVTSRITSKLWFVDAIPLTPDEQNRMTWTSTHRCRFKPSRHWFFVMIGFDQVLHYFQLAVTYTLMVYSPIIHL